MRSYAADLSSEAKQLVDALPNEKDVDQYRQVMTGLGQELGRAVVPQLPSREGLVLICTNEDADFLARGLLETLKAANCQVSLACFWNDRVHLGWGEDRAPILRRYVEPMQRPTTFLVLKSIISSSCVVRTNISELVYAQQPKHIFVLSPVLLHGAQQRLESEFPPDVSSRFHYVWFAEDDEQNDKGEVVPGVGGMVYNLLGLGTPEDKNRFVPELVRERREKLRA